jgi:probable HAF family extracellular repeat protein
LVHALARRCGHVITFALLGAAFLTTPASARTFTPLEPAANLTLVQAFGINDAGQVVGSYSLDPNGELSKAFVYSAGNFTEITGPAGAISVTGFAISDEGTIVGKYASGYIVEDGYSFLGPQRGFLLRNGTYTTFEQPTGWSTEPRAISSNGRYVAGISHGGAFVMDTQTMSFHYLPQPMDPNDPNDPNVPYMAPVLIQGVNDHGIVVGSEIHNLQTGLPASFTYDIHTGVRTDVLLPGATRSAFRGIDNDGTVSGWFEDGAGRHGFIGYPGAYEVIDMPGADWTTVQDHNASGWFVGTYMADGVQRSYLATPVPEPGTWALMLIGAALLPLVRRRR